jgi:hypothetical protein
VEAALGRTWSARFRAALPPIAGKGRYEGYVSTYLDLVRDRLGG